MEYIFVALVIITYILVLFPLRQPRIKAFFFLMGGYWCASLVTSLFNPFDLYSVSPYIYALVSMGYISCFVGFSLRMRKIESFKLTISKEAQIEDIFHFKFFQVTFFVSLIMVGYLASTQWQVILLQGAMGNIKLDFFELVFNNNSALFLLYQMLAFPMFHLSVILLSYNVIRGGNWKYSLLMLLYILLFCFLGGKRGYFAIAFEYFIIVAVLTVFISKNRKKGEIKSLLTKMGLFLAAILIGAAYMTALSGGVDYDKDRMKESNGENVANMIIYNVGAYRAFEYALNNDYLGKAGGYQFGRASFGGFLDYYGTPVLTKIGLPISRVSESTMKQLQDNEIIIGKDRRFNFIYTSFMYFYFDFGVFGILVISFLFGRFLRYCLNLSVTDNSVVSFVLICYLFVTAGLMFGGSWFFISLSAQPILLYFYLLRRKQIKYYNNYAKRTFKKITLHGNASEMDH